MGKQRTGIPSRRQTNNAWSFGYRSFSPRRQTRIAPDNAARIASIYQGYTQRPYDDIMHVSACDCAQIDTKTMTRHLPVRPTERRPAHLYDLLLAPSRGSRRSSSTANVFWSLRIFFRRIRRASRSSCVAECDLM